MGHLRTQRDCLQSWRDLLGLRVHDGDERGDEPRLQRGQRLRRLGYHLEHVLRQRSQDRVWIDKARKFDGTFSQPNVQSVIHATFQLGAQFL